MEVVMTPTAPLMEVVSLTEIKRHLRILHAGEDDYLERLGRDAREFLEHAIGKNLVRTEILLRSEIVEKGFMLPFSPIREIVSATIDGVDVREAFSPDWRILRSGVKFEVRYISGPAMLPGVRQAILDLVAAAFVDRGGDVKNQWGKIAKWFIMQNNTGWFI